MLLLILVILLAALTYYLFKANDGVLIAPDFLYAFSFSLSAIAWYANRDYWGGNLHLNTFCVILGGCIVFAASCRFGRMIYTGRQKKKGNELTNNAKNRTNAPVRVPQLLYIGSIAITSVAIVGAYNYMGDLSFYYGAGGDALSGSGLYNNMNKFSGDNQLVLPGYVSHMRTVSYALYYVCCYYFARNLFASKRKVDYLAVPAFMLTWMLSLLFGARQMFVRLLIVFVVMLIAFGWRKVTHKKNRIKIIAWIMTGALLLAVLFPQIAHLLGRSQSYLNSYDTLYYIGVYLGAPMCNLNAWLNDELYHSIVASSQFWGQQTFAVLWNRILGLDSITIAQQWVLWQPFQYFNGNPTGNVYTQYYTLIFDWGYVGAFLATVCIGVVSGFLYSASLRHCASSAKSFKPSMSLILYSNLVYGIAFSFFLNLLFTNLCTEGFLRQIVVALIAGYLCEAWCLFKKHDNEKVLVSG